MQVGRRRQGSIERSVGKRSEGDAGAAGDTWGATPQPSRAWNECLGYHGGGGGRTGDWESGETDAMCDTGGSWEGSAASFGERDREDLVTHVPCQLPYN